MTRRLAQLAVVLVACATAAVAQARVERYAVFVGNNTGARDEANLRFAIDDAQKMHAVLRALGGYRPENMVLLRNEDAATVRRTIIAINDRIRTAEAHGVETSLFVYYSGHADANALHMGSSLLDMSEIEQLVRGSAARFRFLILDSCRSGALTRVKGGKSAPPFVITLDDRLAGEGVVFLTSSSANEDAQESDRLRGSFFTHYFVSGLLGAADQDGDGRVTLEEAYRHSYENTLRASSRTLAGIQHPTFRYELRGQGKITLTTLSEKAQRRSLVRFPRGRTYLLFRGGAAGPVVAEVGVNDRVRRISVSPGRYFVRARGRDHLLEGELDLAAGSQTRVADKHLVRVDYARLVRKGRGPIVLVHGPQAGFRSRTPITTGASMCHGVFVGYAIETKHVTLLPRVGACRGTFQNRTLSATTDELDAEFRLVHAWDLPVVTLGLGVAAGAALLSERFETAGVAPSRTSGAGYVGAVLSVTRELPAGAYLVLDGSAQTYFFSAESATGQTQLATRFAFRTSLALGWRWAP